MTDRAFKAGDLYLRENGSISWLCVVVRPPISVTGKVRVMILADPPHPSWVGRMYYVVQGGLTKVSA
jgi:hypothetical protein